MGLEDGYKDERMFVDYLKLKIQSGDGGRGCISFRREKYAPRGGPNGGDGGRGGHVIFEPDPRLGTLYDLKRKPNVRAQRGGDGGGNDCHGRDGNDIIINVPLGTVVSDEEGNQLADLTQAGERWIAAHGGRGGKGNAHFATSTNKTPHYAQDGEEGEEKTLILELKLIADVGLVGLPNAGKSTLLSKLTAATPKIAPYPFTTLNPNLGVMEFSDLRRITLADIPGLIEGASRGAGLGDRFLRHIERTRVLAHLVGDESGEFDPEDMIYKFDLVCQELASYSETLARKEQLVLVTKIDLAKPEDIEKTCELFRARGIETLCISAVTGEGLEELKVRLRAMIEEADKAEADDEAGSADRSDKSDLSYVSDPFDEDEEEVDDEYEEDEEDEED